MGKIIEIQNLTFSYGDNIIFNELTVSIPEKSIYTVLGKTGSGKSTLARILMGFEEVHDYIKVCGLYLNPKNLENIRNKVSILFENPDSDFVTDNVFEEIAFPLKNLNYSEENIKKEINRISKEFSISHLLSRNPHNLSSGEKQIVALVAALITKPELLILDESLSMVDRISKEKNWEILKKYQEENNMTILHFTDYSEDILEGTDVMILANGKVLLQEEVKKALQSEKLFTSNQIELPFLVDLSNKLRYYNTIPSIETNLEQLVNTIWK